MLNEILGVPSDKLVLAGACPECGSPIYAPKEIRRDESVKIEYNCTCRFERKTFQDTIKTK